MVYCEQDFPEFGGKYLVNLLITTLVQYNEFASLVAALGDAHKVGDMSLRVVYSSLIY